MAACGPARGGDLRSRRGLRNVSPHRRRTGAGHRARAPSGRRRDAAATGASTEGEAPGATSAHGDGQAPVGDRGADTAPAPAACTSHVGLERPRRRGDDQPTPRRPRVAAARRLRPRCRAAHAARPVEQRGLPRPGDEVPRQRASALHGLPLHDRQLRPARRPLDGSPDVRRDAVRVGRQGLPDIETQAAPSASR